MNNVNFCKSVVVDAVVVVFEVVDIVVAIFGCFCWVYNVCIYLVLKRKINIVRLCSDLIRLNAF